MHNKSHKLVAIVLAILMVASLGIASTAYNFNDVATDNTHREAIDVLTDIGVIVGTSENEFSPDDPITREQMSLLLFRLMLGRENTVRVNSTAFTDLTDPTYYGAISWANAAGYIIGTSATTFEPTGGITFQDAMTMLVRALGQDNASMNGGYPWTFINAAVLLGLDNGLEDIAYEKELTRAQTAHILYNALTADYLRNITSSNGVATTEKTTIIESVFGYEMSGAKLVATNLYALEGYEVTLRRDYVTLLLEDNRTVAVPFADLGLSGNAENWLARSFRLTYQNQNAFKILGAFSTSDTFASDEAIVTDSGIKIGNIVYQAVEKLSEASSTDKNELLVYTYGTDGSLRQVKNNNELAALLGFYQITVDAKDRTAILMPFLLGQLTITDKGAINLAGGLTEKDLTGGLRNECGAVSGDYVLYYYNGTSRQLVLHEVLKPTANATVTRLTDSSVTIGANTYAVGNAIAGISAESILSSLTIGSTASVLVKNGSVVAVLPKAETPLAASTYLIMLSSEALPVYADGDVRYTVKVNIDGTIRNIFIEKTDVSANTVYRYTVDNTGIYKLYAYDSNTFLQGTDLQGQFSTEEELDINMKSGPFYTLGATSFVTDADSVIIIGHNGSYEMKKGVYTYGFTMHAGATATAVFRNEIGNVKTLKYLYITDGSFGETNNTTNFVRVLSRNSTDFINGVVCYEYTVLDFAQGKIVNMYSLDCSLNMNGIYAVGHNGYLVNETTDLLSSGELTGYTATTVTIGEQVFSISDTTKFLVLEKDQTLTETNAASLLNSNVEYLANGSALTLVLITK